MAYSGMALPSTTNWTVASDEDRKTNMAVVAWLASAAMPSSRSNGPMMIPPPMPRKPPRKPAAVESSGYNHNVVGVHASTPSAASEALAFCMTVLAPAQVKAKQVMIKPPNCIQYALEHCVALSMFAAKNTSQQPRINPMERVLLDASFAKVGMSTNFSLSPAPPLGARPSASPPPPPEPWPAAACSSNTLLSFLNCAMPLVSDFCSARTKVTMSTRTMIHWGLMRFSITPRVTPTASPGFNIMITS
mmetsp:Transcript_88755/g.255964  ORF Transcript_88755/g.255964 Transcript_88755/m.255964 type:complete len:247 (+) Transcript_88755:188-928(+)